MRRRSTCLHHHLVEVRESHPTVPFAASDRSSLLRSSDRKPCLELSLASMNFGQSSAPANAPLSAFASTFCVTTLQTEMIFRRPPQFWITKNGRPTFKISIAASMLSSSCDHAAVSFLGRKEARSHWSPRRGHRVKLVARVTS